MGHDAMQMSALYLVLRIREHYSFYNCNVKMSNKVKRGLFYTSLCTRRRLWAPLCHAEIQRVIWYQAVIVTSILMSPISTRSVLKLKQNRLKKIKKKSPPIPLFLSSFMSAAVAFHTVLTWKTCLQCLPVPHRNKVYFAALFEVTDKQNLPINLYDNAACPKCLRKRLCLTIYIWPM